MSDAHFFSPMVVVVPQSLAVSSYELPRSIDPSTDLVPVCPNCHAVIHRKKAQTLSVSDVRALLNEAAAMGDPSTKS